jgi:hypothetical protein
VGFKETLGDPVEGTRVGEVVGTSLLLGSGDPVGD